MSEFQFLNIYSGTPPQGKAGSNSEPALWNVYLNKKENAYLIQKLDGNNKPTAEKYKISPTYFGINFRQVNNSELKHAVDKNLGQLGVDKGKNESFLDSLFSSRSAFSATVQKSKNGKKKTGEFAFQTGKENQQSQRKKTDSAPAGNVPDKKVNNEFQFNLGAQSAEKASRNDKSAIRDFGLETLPNPEEMEKMLRKENAQGTINRENTTNSASNFSEQENEEKIPLINQEKKSTTEHGSSIAPIPSIKKIAEHEEIHNAPASIAKQSPAASKTKAVDAITKTEEALLPAKGGAFPRHRSFQLAVGERERDGRGAFVLHSHGAGGGRGGGEGRSGRRGGAGGEEPFGRTAAAAYHRARPRAQARNSDIGRLCFRARLRDGREAPRGVKAARLHRVHRVAAGGFGEARG